jgi:hypothetical protein
LRVPTRPLGDYDALARPSKVTNKGGQP